MSALSRAAPPGRLLKSPSVLIDPAAVDAFLHRGGSHRAALLAQVHASVGLGVGDVLLGVGSIVEGLANSKSDLDLMLVRPRSADSVRLPANGELTLVEGRCLVDVEVVHAEHIRSLVSRLSEWSKLQWVVAHAAKFTAEERRLLHRLAHCHILYAGQRERILGSLPTAAEVARLKLHVARHLSRTVQVDMAGYREARDYRSLVFAAQELLGHAADALSAGYQLTNSTPKWRGRLLERLPSHWERSLWIRPTGLTAAELVWRLHRSPAAPSERSSAQHAFRIAEFARATFVWAERHLIAARTLKGAYPDWGRAKPRAASPTLPRLNLDVDFALGGRQVSVARLNEFGQALELSRREFALSLLFDGRTTAVEAATCVFGSATSPSKITLTQRLAQRMIEAKLTVPVARKSP